VAAVELADRFWAPRMRINRDVTVPSQHRYLEETGRLDNFRRAAGKVDRRFEGIYFKQSVSGESAFLAVRREPGKIGRHYIDLDAFGVHREWAKQH